MLSQNTSLGTFLQTFNCGDLKSAHLAFTDGKGNELFHAVGIQVVESCLQGLSVGEGCRHVNIESDDCAERMPPSLKYELVQCRKKKQSL